jgi:hypothetical protein
MPRASIRNPVLALRVCLADRGTDVRPLFDRNERGLLAVLERELAIVDRGDRPDYKVIRAIISYFELYPEMYHHPLEDLVFSKLKLRDPAAAAKVGGLTLEHQKGAKVCAASPEWSITSSRIMKSCGKMWRSFAIS